MVSCWSGGDIVDVGECNVDGFEEGREKGGDGDLRCKIEKVSKKVGYFESSFVPFNLTR